MNPIKSAVSISLNALPSEAPINSTAQNTQVKIGNNTIARIQKNAEQSNGKSLGEKDCSICLSSIFETPLALHCKHEFHPKCLTQWFDHGDMRCPNCNSPVDLSYENTSVSARLAERLLPRVDAPIDKHRAEILIAIGELAVKRREPYISIHNKIVKPYSLFQTALRVDPENPRACRDLAITWPANTAVLKIKQPEDRKLHEVDRNNIINQAIRLNPDNQDLLGLLKRAKISTQVQNYVR